MNYSPEAGYFGKPNRVGAVLAAGLALAIPSVFGVNKAQGAEAQPSCDVSSLVFQGFTRDNGKYTYGRFMGNSNCRLVADSLGDIENGVNRTWNRWDIIVDGRHITRKHGPITQIRLPNNHAKIEATYTAGYGSVTSTRVNFKPQISYPEADMVVTPADKVVTQGP